MKINKVKKQKSKLKLRLRQNFLDVYVKRLDLKFSYSKPRRFLHVRMTLDIRKGPFRVRHHKSWIATILGRREGRKGWVYNNGENRATEAIFVRLHKEKNLFNTYWLATEANNTRCSTLPKWF